MSRRRTVSMNVAALAVGAALLSGCGTGLQAETYQEQGRQDGADTTTGNIAVRDLHISPPATGSTIATTDPAVVSGVLVNSGDSADQLLSATSAAAGTAGLQVAGAVATAVPVPAHGTSPATWSIVLTGLTKDLRPGEYVDVTLVFDKAGRTTLQVPVRAGDNGLADRKAAQNPYSEG